MSYRYKPYKSKKPKESWHDLLTQKEKHAYKIFKTEDNIAKKDPTLERKNEGDYAIILKQLLQQNNDNNDNN